MPKSKALKIVVVLNNLRSSENVGSIFRTCDAAQVSKVILCGYTPAPTDRFGLGNKKLAKAALGAEKFVEWEKIEDLKETIERLKTERFKIVGVEQDTKAINYRSFKTKILDSEFHFLAFIFGNEGDGLSQEDLKLCDHIIQIPMRGRKESLNVSVAVGIILFSTQ